MPPHLRRDLAKERRWRGIIANWQASDISITEYCRLHDIPYRDLANWRRIIRRRDHEQGAQHQKTNRAEKKASRAPETSAHFSRRLEPVDFAEVQIVDKRKNTEEPRSAGSAVLEVVLTSGISLRVNESCPLNFLSSVVKALESH